MPGAVRQTEIADEKIELLRVGDSPRGGERVGGFHVISEALQKPLHRARRVGVIFDEEDARRSGPRGIAWIGSGRGGLRNRKRERERERRAAVLAVARSREFSA